MADYYDYGNFYDPIGDYASQPMFDLSSPSSSDLGTGITYGVDNTPTGWYDNNGTWQSYADVAASNGGLDQYLSGGQDYSYSPSLMDQISSTLDPLAAFSNKYGSLLTGGASILGNLWDYYQKQEQNDLYEKLAKERLALEQQKAQDSRNQYAYEHGNDVDKQKLIMARMQQMGMLAPGIDPNEALGRAYSNSQQAFGPGTSTNLNTFKDNPYSQVPVFTPLLAADPQTQGFAAGGPVHGALSSLTSGQADDVPINVSGGEFVFPADVVAHLGDGNSRAGGLALSNMVEEIRSHKGASNKLPPKAKAPRAYLKG